jgi:hypothetical protein
MTLSAWARLFVLASKTFSTSHRNLAFYVTGSDKNCQPVQILMLAGKPLITSDYPVYSFEINIQSRFAQI